MWQYMVLTPVKKVRTNFLLHLTLVLNVVVEWSTFLLCIWEVPGSDLSLETSYPEVFHGFTQSLQANAGIEP
jgi:hypothetical protein